MIVLHLQEEAHESLKPVCEKFQHWLGDDGLIDQAQALAGFMDIASMLKESFGRGQSQHNSESGHTSGDEEELFE